LKIVVNLLQKGLRLSSNELHLYADLAGLKISMDDTNSMDVYLTDKDDNWISERTIPRDCPHLITIAENSHHLSIIEIPDNTEWTLTTTSSYPEYITTPHKRWTPHQISTRDFEGK